MTEQQGNDAWQRLVQSLISPEAMAALAQTVSKAVEPLRPSLILAQHIEQILQPLRPALDALSAGFAEWATHFRDTLTELDDRGWVLGSDTPVPMIMRARELLLAGDEEALTAYLSGIVATQGSRIVQEMGELHPQRAVLLTKAWSAHEQGHFELSIPVFLSQADGIAFDLFEGEFFRRSSSGQTNASVKAALALEELAPSGSLSAALVQSLRSGSSIGIRTDKREARRAQEPYYGPLNRHAVLHGHDKDYGTEANSLRALVLVNYVANVGVDLRKSGSKPED